MKTWGNEWMNGWMNSQINEKIKDGGNERIKEWLNN